MQGRPAHSSAGWSTQKPMRLRRKVEPAAPSIAKAMRPSASALDAALPVEAHAAAAVAGHEADAEGLGLGLDLEVLERGRHRGPALLAHGHVDAAQDLALAEPDPAQLAAVEDEPQRPRAQRDRELGGRVDVSGAGRGVRLGSMPRSPTELRAGTYQERGAVVHGTMPPCR